MWCKYKYKSCESERLMVLKMDNLKVKNVFIHTDKELITKIVNEKLQKIIKKAG